MPQQLPPPRRPRHELPPQQWQPTQYHQPTGPQPMPPVYSDSQRLGHAAPAATQQRYDDSPPLRRARAAAAPAPAPEPRNGLGIAALVLGLVALPGLISGVTAWISVILGLIAIPLALAGLGRVRRGRATNRGTATTGAVLGVIAVVVGIAAIVVTVQAVDDVLNGPNATVAAAPGSASSAGTEQPSGPVPIGTAVDVDGLTVTVMKVDQRTDFGQRLTCATVSYANNTGDVAHRNPFDWAAANKSGASTMSYLYTGKGALDAGDLAAGGSDEGVVCFDMPRTEVAAIQYKASILSSGPTAEWAVR